VLGGATDQTLLQEAERTINTAIATRQAADGSFTDPTAGGQPADIATMFFGVEFGATYQLLSPYLTPATRALWGNSLAAAANYLVNHGDASWYSNGNINLGFAELFYLAWKATGRANLLRDYNNEWSFLVSPPQNKFPGAGLKIIKQPTAADGSDGAGYLAETGPGGTGFDPEYTMLQLDVAARLYLLSGDPRALRLANLEVNILKPRTSSTMMLDTSGGTRHTQPNRQVGFQDSAAVVLSLFDGRSDLAPLAIADLSAEKNWFQWASQDNPVFRRALGDSMSVAALAEAMYKKSPTITDSLASTTSTGSATVRVLRKPTASKRTVRRSRHRTRRHRHRTRRHRHRTRRHSHRTRRHSHRTRRHRHR
jgi:hypothetical protein